MQDELRSVLDLMIQQDSTLEIHTTPDVYITQNSNPRDVRKWLRDKEFSQRYCITYDFILYTPCPVDLYLISEKSIWKNQDR